MSGFLDHLHVKKRTAGSSNELSFDVLDAARDELDGKKGLYTRIADRAKQVQGDYQGTNPKPQQPRGSSPQKASLSDNDKTRRRLLASGALVVVLALIAGVIVLMQNLTQNPADDKPSFADELPAVVSGLASVDEVFPAVDQVMAASPENVEAETRADALSGFAGARAALDETAKAAEALDGLAVTDNEKTALDQLNQTVKERYAILDRAERAMKLAAQSDDEVAQISAAWSRVFEADQLARAATEQANAAVTEEETQVARDSTQQALDQMNAVLAQFQDMSGRYSTLDLSVQIEYLQKRVEALEHATATSDALLAGDREVAQSENEAYNAADQEAASMAEELPISIDQFVREAFTQQMKEYCTQYFDARDHAAELDDAIGGYLSHR